MAAKITKHQRESERRRGNKGERAREVEGMAASDCSIFAAAHVNEKFQVLFGDSMTMNMRGKEAAGRARGKGRGKAAARPAADFTAPSHGSHKKLSTTIDMIEIIG